MYFYHGCLFHWFAKTQHSVSLSSAESEYFGAMLASRDILFLRDLFVDLGIHFDSPTIIRCDSKSAVGMSFDPVAFKNTKHIMRAAEFLRDLVLKGHVTLEHLPGDVMIADILTKAVARTVFSTLMGLILNFADDKFIPRSPATRATAPPVNAADCAAARARLLAGRPLLSDEVLLSHAVSRGVSCDDSRVDIKVP